jgi:hypothetical protein
MAAAAQNCSMLRSISLSIQSRLECTIRSTVRRIAAIRAIIRPLGRFVALSGQARRS